MATDAALEAQQGWSSEGSDGSELHAPTDPSPRQPNQALSPRNLNGLWKPGKGPIDQKQNPSGSARGHGRRTGA